MDQNIDATRRQWDERYGKSEFAYGEQPNDFLRSVAPRFAPGSRILSLAEGEGRNAVFLASLGHEVTGVDISPVGLAKAEALASKHGVSITTTIADLAKFEINENSWDVIVSIWCHTPPAIRQRLHRACVSGLKSGGLLILEAYTPKQLEYKTGGPPDAQLMMTLDDLRSELAGLEFLIGQEVIRDIHEGPFHDGLSSVVQVMARKS